METGGCTSLFHNSSELPDRVLVVTVRRLGWSWGPLTTVAKPGAEWGLWGSCLLTCSHAAVSMNKNKEPENVVMVEFRLELP